MPDIFTTVAIITLAVAAVTDLKWREVPDWLSYAAIAAGAGLRLLHSSYYGSWSYITEGIAGFAVFFVVAYAAYYLGGWGGGDSKMLMAIGALLGLNASFSHIGISFIINTIFIGAVYNIIWTSALAIKYWNGFVRNCKTLLARKDYRLMLITGYAAIAVLLLSLSFTPFEIKTLTLFVAAACFLLATLVLAVKAVEKAAMTKKVPVSQLTEGDWIARNIFVKGRRIAGPKDRGISTEHIRELKRLGVKNLLVKTGIPFVPVFFIAIVVTAVYNNIALLIF